MLLRRHIFLTNEKCYNYKNLLCWYSGQEKNGLKDSSLYNCPTSIDGISVTLDTANKCYNFDGKSSINFNCPALKNILSTTQSLSFWFKCTDSDRRILFANAAAYPYNMELSSGTSGVAFRYYIDNNPDYTISTSYMSFSYNTWYYMVIAHTSMSKVQFYVNSVLKHTYTGTTKFSTTLSNNFRWGSDGRYGSSLEAYVAFKGYMADMRVYNYTLSSLEVQKIYNEQSKLFIKK